MSEKPNSILVQIRYLPLRYRVILFVWSVLMYTLGGLGMLLQVVIW